MVNATEWINQNYPENDTCQRVDDKENYGRKREEIVNLDVSNQNLEGSFDIHIKFDKLRKLNASFNKLNFYWIPLSLEEIDFSHNQFDRFSIENWNIKRFNISFNYVGNFGSSFANAHFLTHLDCSNNLLTELDLRSSSKSLIELKCSSNSITNLSLNEVPNLVFFDCLGVKLTTPISSSFCPSSTSHISSTETVCTNNSALVGLGMYSGISTLGWIILGFIFFYKRLLWKAVIPTAGS